MFCFPSATLALCRLIAAMDSIKLSASKSSEVKALIRIRFVQLREIHLPLLHAFETSAERTTLRKIILVMVRSDFEEGYGECTAGETPFYNSETTETAWHMLCDFVIPPVLGRKLERASDGAAILQPIRGNLMARAALETALWDLEARSRGLPLYRHIGGGEE